MPEVKGKSFPYTEKGIKEAEEEIKILGRDKTQGINSEFSEKVMNENLRREEEAMKRLQKEMGMSYGGEVKKMKAGGKCRGMGKATRGGDYTKV